MFVIYALLYKLKFREKIFLEDNNANGYIYRKQFSVLRNCYCGGYTILKKKIKDCICFKTNQKMRVHKHLQKRCITFIHLGIWLQLSKVKKYYVDRKGILMQIRELNVKERRFIAILNGPHSVVSIYVKQSTHKLHKIYILVIFALNNTHFVLCSLRNVPFSFFEKKENAYRNIFNKNFSRQTLLKKSLFCQDNDNLNTKVYFEWNSLQRYKFVETVTYFRTA